MPNYKLPVITGTALGVGDILRWDGSNWVNTPLFVNRGNVTAYDWTEGDFTRNGSWYILDMSAVLPANTKAVLLTVTIQDSLAAKYFRVTPYGYANAYAESIIGTQVGNMWIAADWIIPTDGYQSIEYAASSGLDVIDMVVKGWWL